MIPIVKDLNPSLEEDFVLSNIKRLVNTPQNDFFLSQISTAREKCLQYAIPRVIYQKFHIKWVSGDEVCLDNGERFIGRYVAKILRGSQIAILFALTLGDKIDEYIHSFKKGKMGITSAFLTEMVASLMLREATCLLLNHVNENEIQKKGWGTTCTYSPGEETWPLVEQKKLFNLLDTSRIGIELTDNCIMKPLKSISGLFGLGPKGKIDKTRSACDLCSRRDCIMRY